MRSLLLLVFAIGCGGGDDKTPDAAPAAACTGAVYDPCTDNSQCMSQSCRLFQGDGFQVCTQTCTPGSACPMAGATAVTCNNMGFCKPPAPNNCTR